MSQRCLHSALEALANVIIGWLVAVLVQLAVFPAVGLQVGLWQHVRIGLAFAAMSLLRSDALRRLVVWRV